jgi:hypothetical protein
VRKEEKGFAFLIASRRAGLGATAGVDGRGSDVGNG